MNQWTPKRVRQRYPKCAPEDLQEVANLLSESREPGIGYHEAKGRYLLAHQLAGGTLDRNERELWCRECGEDWLRKHPKRERLHRAEAHT